MNSGVQTLLVTTRYLQGTNQPKVQTQSVKKTFEFIVGINHTGISHPENRRWGVERILRRLEHPKLTHFNGN